MSSTFTLEFGHEYEKERGRWLRRRFLWYAATNILLNLLGLFISTTAIIFIVFVAPNVVDQQTDPTDATAQQAMVTQEGPEAGPEPAATPDPVVTAFESGGGRWATAVATLTQQGSAIPAYFVAIALFGTAFQRVRRSSMSREALLGLVSRLIIYSGAAGTLCIILGYEVLQWVSPEDYQILESIGYARETVRAALIGVMLSHFLASLFLPWTPRESLRPIIPLAILNFGVALVYSWDRPAMVGTAILLSLVIAVPGLAVCWLRTSRFRSKFHFKMVTRRYGEMKTELDAARQIHDAMFPAPIADGPVRMRYAYEPMRQIGGDYLFTHRVDTQAGEGRGLLVVLLDVTGHGITAALTVNRLQGEIERQVSMNRAVSPGTVLSGLNEYLHHTLARHSVYATALVVRIDPDAGTAVWASAGHPPGFLCTVDGTIHHLESTTIVLGATRGEHFQSVEEQLPFGRGDTLLAYTDGVIEAKNDHGRMLRIEGVEKFLAGHCRAGGQDEDVPRLLLEYVNGFRAGPPQDDSLIVEVRRPVS